MITIYQADTYCDDCGWEILAALVKEQRFPSYWTPAERKEALRRYDAGYDSPGCDADTDDWPSIGHPPEATDSPQHCGAREGCRNAETLPSGRKIGKLLGDALTDEGRAYVREAIAEGGEVAEFWRENLWWEE